MPLRLDKLTRVRNDVAWRFMHSFTHAGPKLASPYDPLATPLFADQVVGGVPLMVEFCSNPVPALRVQTASDFSRNYELLPGAVGQKGAATLVAAEIYHRFAFRKAEGGTKQFVHATRMRTPAALVVSELIVERSVYGAIEPEAILHDLMSFSGPFPGPSGEMPERMRMPIVLESLGSMDRAMPALTVPRYTAMMQAVFGKIQRDPADFDLYRTTIQYPAIPTMLTVAIDLPS
jgi:hypothetical protein